MSKKPEPDSKIIAEIISRDARCLQMYRAIKANFKILDMLIPELDRLIAGKIDELKIKMYTLIPVVIGITALAIYLFMGLYQSFISAISALNNASTALAKGNLTQRIQLDNQDEFSDLADSFNNMANQFSGIIRHLEVSVEQLASCHFRVYRGWLKEQGNGEYQAELSVTWLVWYYGPKDFFRTVCPYNVHEHS